MAEFDRKGGWSTILFSAVLFGHPAEPARSHGYMVKALQNLEIIHARCPGARTVLYYDGTVSDDLLAQIRVLGLAVTLVWVEHLVGRGIMLARMLELTARRPGVRWVVMLDRDCAGSRTIDSKDRRSSLSLRSSHLVCRSQYAFSATSGAGGRA